MKRFICLSVFLFCWSIQKSDAQCSNGPNAYAGTYYLGFSNPGGNVPFATNGVAQMTLTTNGDLNIIGSGNGYQIGGSYVLWNNGNGSDIFVGVGAGTVGAGNNNTLAS